MKYEWMIIYNVYQNFHTKICMFTAQGLGRKEHTISHLHTLKCTISQAHTRSRAHVQPSMHAQSEDKWEGELQVMKEVRLESGLERMN